MRALPGPQGDLGSGRVGVTPFRTYRPGRIRLIWTERGLVAEPVDPWEPEYLGPMPGWMRPFLEFPRDLRELVEGR